MKISVLEPRRGLIHYFQFTRDGAYRDSDGYYWIRGRVDDVVNVSDHRLSISEIESALIEHSMPYIPSPGL